MDEAFTLALTGDRPWASPLDKAPHHRRGRNRQHAIARCIIQLSPTVAQTFSAPRNALAA